ncbi:MAG: hypothetical protein R3C59_18345 [Planctomycetaceae bacterium]
MAKNKQQKQKEREKRVAQKKLAEAARRREIAKKSDEKPTGVPRGKKVITEGVKQKSQVQSAKPTVTHRRSGGG